MLIDRLTADLIEARKAQHEIKTSVLRVWLSECDAARGRQGVAKSLDDAKVLQIGRKIAKNMNETYEMSKNRRYLAEYQDMMHYIRPYDEMDKSFAPVDINAAIDQIMADNPEKELNEKTVGWFVGQVMKVTGGKANPKAVKEMLLAK